MSKILDLAISLIDPIGTTRFLLPQLSKISNAMTSVKVEVLEMRFAIPSNIHHFIYIVPKTD